MNVSCQAAALKQGKFENGAYITLLVMGEAKSTVVLLVNFTIV